MTVPVDGDPRRTQGGASARVQPVELAAPGRGVVAATQGQPRTRDGSTAIVRPGALTQLLADLARAPEGAGWDVPLEPGQAVGRFEIQREIGRGGFGVVYEARDQELGRSVAFKAIRASGADAAREARALGEAEAAARLAHPNIVHLYDVGRSEQGAFLIMELLRGKTLAGRLREGPLPLREAVQVAVEISRGLAHAHQQGVLHRDLKPSNVFLCDDGQVKVLDFGLAHVFGRAGIAGGTPAYMAPEQSKGETGDERSDVYSLGVVVREMLTGRLPVLSPSPPPHATDGSPLSPAAAGERGQPAVTPAGVRGPVERKLPSAPTAFARLVARMLARDPAQRPADGGEAHGALLAVQKSLEPKRLLWASAAIAAAALIGAGAFAWLWQRPLPPGPLVAAVSDTANQTGDVELDGVSELLQAGLQQTRRLSLMGRARLVNLLREAGARSPEVIDEALARQAAARGQAQLLIVPAARRVDDAYELSVRVSDLPRGEPRFALTATALTKATLRETTDGLTREVRRRLGEGPGDVAEPIVPATDLAPASPEAWARYAEGRRLWSVSQFDAARDAYAKAIALAPDFALALQAIIELSLDGLVRSGDFRADVFRALRRNVQRLPARERPYAESLLLYDVERGMPTVAEIIAANDRAIEAWPENPRPYRTNAWMLAVQHADIAAARPYLEKAIALAPLQEHTAIDDLIFLGRSDEALARARRWTAETPSWLAFTNLAAVHRHRGETEEALDAAREALARGYLILEADAGTVGFAFADADAADEWERLGGGQGFTWRVLRGRVREALAWRPAKAAGPGSFWNGTVVHFARGDTAGLAQEAEGLFRSGQVTWCLAWPLAALGDLEAAERLAATGASFGDRHHVCLRTYRLLRAWKKGDREGALRGLEDVATATSHFYRGEILAELGRDREAVEEYRLSRRIGWSPWEGHVSVSSYPRSLYLEAAALERLGERDEARKVLGRLLLLWERADPDLPLLAEAKALQRRLGADAKRR